MDRLQQLDQIIAADEGEASVSRPRTAALNLDTKAPTTRGRPGGATDRLGALDAIIAEDEHSQALAERRTVGGQARAAALNIPRTATGLVGGTARGLAALVHEPENVQDSALYRAGERAEQFGADRFGLPEEYEGTLVTDLAGGIASMGTFMLTGGAGGAVTRGAARRAGMRDAGDLKSATRAGQLGAAAALAAPAGADEAYQRALEFGLSPEEAQVAARKGVVPGVIQIANINFLLRPLPVATRRALLEGRKGHILMSGLSEFTVEGAGAIGQNIIERAYNPETGLFDEAAYRAMIGGLSGAGIQAGRAALTRREKPKDSAPSRTPDPERELPDSIKQEIKALQDQAAGLSPEEGAELVARVLPEIMQRAEQGSADLDDAPTMDEQLGALYDTEPAPMAAPEIAPEQAMPEPAPEPASKPAAAPRQEGDLGWLQGEQRQLVAVPQGERPVLQNRDRSTPGMISQMRSIASNPDYSRLSFSRQFAEGAPVVEPGAELAQQQLGRQDVAVSGAGRSIPVQYAAVEADQLLPSNDINGSMIPDYQEGLPGRSRAIAGNGRIAGLRHAYAQGTADQYREDMAADASLHGIDPDVIRAMRQPVLVRIMPQEEVTANIGDESNISGTADLSPAETARNDMRRIDLEGIEFTDDGRITDAAARGFIRAMPEAEWNGLLDGNRPNRAAFDRLENAVFAAAYESDALIALQAQATDTEARTVMQGLLIAAPKMARLRGQGEYDIRPLVTEAAELAINARRAGHKLSDYIQQIDMEASPEVVPILEMMAENIRSARRIGESLSALADTFYNEATAPTEDMFGEVEKTPREALLRRHFDGEQEGSGAAGLEGRTEPAEGGDGGQAVEPGESGSVPRPETTERAEPAGEAKRLALTPPDTPAESTDSPAQAGLSASQGDDFALSAQTPEEIAQRERAEREAEEAETRRRQEEEQRAQADSEALDFRLTGSGAPADVAAAGGQTDIFATPRRDIDAQANQAATSPDNDLPEPTPAQIEAGNYQKGHIRLHGLDISIENPRGSTRSGVDADGNRWERELAHHYGYIKRSEGADGEHVDVFVGPREDSTKVFVIDQVNQEGAFDEHKVMLGFSSKAAAKKGYRDNYDQGWKVGPVTEMTIEQFKEWLEAGNTTQPLSEESAAQPEDAPQQLEGATAPEHTRRGTDDAELDQIVDEFNRAQEGIIQGDHPVSNVFQAPKKKEVVRLADRVKVYTKEHGWMSPAEARAKIDEWKAHAREQGEDSAIRSANSDKVVLSLFDLSGSWSQPWVDAGYQVYRFDIQNDPDMGDAHNFSSEFFSDWFGDFEGADIYAVLAACPCTDFAVSGARHFAAKDKDGRTVSSVRLVHQTLNVIEHFKPAVWAIENPVGRIERLGGLPPWRLSFDPNHLGEDYTKKTLLWGRFNAELPIAPAEATEGSKMHRRYGGRSMATKNARSETPEGFAYSFFMANNAHDHQAMAVANKFDRLDRDLIERAIDAGVAPEQIETAVEDFYYMDLDDDAANAAIRDLIEASNDAAPQPAESGVDRLTRRYPELPREFLRLFAESDVAGEEFGFDATNATMEIKGSLRTFAKGRHGETLFFPFDMPDALLRELGLRRAKDAQGETDAEYLASAQEAAAGAIAARIDKMKAEEVRRIASEWLPSQLGQGEAMPRSKTKIKEVVTDPERVNLLGAADAFGVGLAESVRDALMAGFEGRPAAAKPAPRKSDWGEKNKVFTKDAAEKARELLRKKGREMRSGIDPEMMQAGITLAGYHIEAGARRFSDYARAMVEDLGEWVVPYLRSWYEGVRHYPGHDSDGMDGADIIDGTNLEQELANVSTTDTDLESDRAGTDTADGMGEGLVPDESGAAGAGAGAGGRGAAGTGLQQQGDLGLATGAAATDGEPGDTAVPGEQRGGRSNAGLAGRDERAGSPGIRGSRAGHDAGAGAAVEAAHSEQSLSSKREQQRQANKVKVIPADQANIHKSLPFLMPGQREDVALAERRLFTNFNPRERGVLLTNGTGTGKTYVGLGLINRFYRQGMRDILIVVPSDAKAKDWIEDAKNLDIPVTQLGSTKDGGSGVSVTTYANFRQNLRIQARDMDLVVYDESHRINENQDGTTTAAEIAHRALTNTDFHSKARFRHPEYVRLMEGRAARIRDEIKEMERENEARRRAVGGHGEVLTADAIREQAAARVDQQIQSELTPYHHEFQEMKEALEAQYAESKKGRVLFLSASPFAYHFTLNYANGYLFNWSPEQTDGSEGLSYNSGSPRDQFMMQHFGYRMRYNKLTIPESGVDIDLMERQFHESLKKTGALSGRSLDIPQDYSRDFIEIDSAIGASMDLGMKVAQNLTFDDDVANDLADRWARFESEGSGQISLHGIELTKTNEDTGTRAIPAFKRLASAVRRKWNYNYVSQVRESMLAENLVERLEGHLELGRKVVVFHDFQKSNLRHPFDFDHLAYRFSGEEAQVIAENEAFRNEVALFHALYPEMRKLPVGGLRSVVDVVQDAFAGRAAFFSGKVSDKVKTEAKRLFNDPDSGVDIIVVQRASGKEGLSLHDVDGRFPRALIDMGLPIRPTDSLQTEGRIYRVGQKTDAVIEYPVLGTSFESFQFASKVSQRARTAENLAMGNEARNIEAAFIEGYQEARAIAPSAEQGRGGKERDRTKRVIDGFDEAKTYYFAQRKVVGKRDQRDGADYFATPEPVGFKMVEWAGARPNESMLEPSAGHGAIARFFPGNTRNHFVEPSAKLAQRLALNAPGGAHSIETFEQLNLVNKFDAIVMNPPYGAGGKTAAEHVRKAMRHLRDGGRIVALIPQGAAANKRFDTLLYESDDAKGIHVVASIGLPRVTFERAGTAVSTRILVLEKQTSADRAAQIKKVSRDLSSAENIAELFDRLKDMSVPERLAAAPDQEAAGPAGALESVGMDTYEFDHTQTGERVFLAIPKTRMGDQHYRTAAAAARRHGGWWNRFARGTAKKGFAFKSEEARRDFLAELQQDEQARFSEAEGPAAIATLTGRELDAETNPLRAAREYYAAHIQGKTINRDGVGEIRFSHKGWKKLKRGLTTDKQKAQLIPALMDIVARGVYHGRAPVRNRSDAIVAFHYFDGHVDLAGEIIQVGVTVGEDAHGNLFYNLNHDADALWRKKKEAPPTRVEARLQAPPPGSKESLAEIVSPPDDGVNIAILSNEARPKAGLSASSVRKTLRRALGERLSDRVKVVQSVADLPSRDGMESLANAGRATHDLAAINVDTLAFEELSLVAGELLGRVTAAYESGDTATAESLDPIAEAALDRLEHELLSREEVSAEEAFGEQGDPYEEAEPSLEALLARTYYERFVAQDHTFQTDADAIANMRDALWEFGGAPLREGVTDQDVLAAARDAYETKAARIRKARQRMRRESRRHGRIEGMYDPATGEVYLVADNLASEDRAAWVAWHELWHRGARSTEGFNLTQVLNRARLHKTVRELADAIQADRGMPESKRMIAVEEALAELNAADETGNYDAIRARYGVQVPLGMRPGIRGHIGRFLDAVRAILRRLGVGRNAVLDREVIDIVRGARGGYDGGNTQVQRQAVAEKAAADYSPAQGDLFNQAPAKSQQKYFEAKIETDLVETGSILTENIPVRSAADLVRLLRPYADYAREVFLVVPLDENNRPLGILRHTAGDLSSAAVYTHIIAGDMALSGAREYWVAHNHPSGKSDPSRADQHITKQLTDVVGQFGINMAGHVVMGRGVYSELSPVGDLLEVSGFTSQGENFERVRILERLIVRRDSSFEMGRGITSPKAAELAARDAGINPATDTGLMLLDNQHRLMDVAYLDKGQDATKLRNTDAARALLERIARANASAVIAFSPDRKATLNLARLGNAAGTRAMDGFAGNFDSLASREGMPAKEIFLSVAEGNTEAKERQRTFLDGIGSQPIDRMFRMVFDILDMVDSHGRLKAGVKLDQGVRNALTKWKPNPDGTFGWMNPMIEKARAGLIDRYGLTPEYKQRWREAESEVRRRLGEAYDLFENTLKDMPVSEAKLLQAVLTGEAVPSEAMAQVSEPIRRAIDDMGREMVNLGLLDAETHERNRASYLHRSYLKHEAQFTGLSGWVQQLGNKRRRRIQGNALRQRGMEVKLTMQELQKGVAHDWWKTKLQDGKADLSLKDAEFIVFERLEPIGEGTIAMDGLPEGGPARRRVRERHYWPADKPAPAKYQAWESRGKWKVIGTRGDKLRLWRDYTKAERTKMGEILDARYNIVKTFETLSQDIAMGRFFSDVAKNPEWFSREMPDTDGVVIDATRAGRLDTFAGVDWVKVPTTKTHLGAGAAPRWGALSGGYVRAEIWRDLNELDKMHVTGTWRPILNQWKLNKALALDTLLPTPDGWTTMGDVKEGDTLFDEKGRPCTVLEVKEIQHGRPCFEVAFSDGTTIIADDDHWWFTEHRNRGGGVRTTKEIRESLTINSRGDAAHSVPVTEALELPEADLPLAPYALGMWLGDGHSTTPRLTVGGAVVDEVARLLSEAGLFCGKRRLDPRSTAVTFTIDTQPIVAGSKPNLLKEALRSLNLLGNKHLPKAYLRSSIEQRLALLQGLMDADGWVTDRGTCGFATSAEPLRDGVLELLRSLGFKPTVSEKRPASGRVSWRIHFQAYTDAPVARLRDKASRLRERPESRQRSGTRQIVAITSVQSVPVRCIAVSSASHLFLAGSGMIPTHNTARSPVVHMNNVMSNFMLMDLADVRLTDFIRGINAYAKGTQEFRDAMEHGAFESSFIQQEIRQRVLQPVLDDVLAENLKGGDSLIKRLSVLSRFGYALTESVKKADRKMVQFYQVEDEIFRMATYMRRLDLGDSPAEAAAMAREQFLDYDIRAPWVNAARRTVLPFISYTYRAVPVVAQSIVHRPWKLAKYFTVAYLAQALAYELAPGDEDEERRTMREEAQGYTWVGVPRMLRMPYRDQNDNPAFLDVRRWIPAGDVFDMNQGQSALPIPAPLQFGGPLMLGAELVLNKQAFTGREIVDPTTATALDVTRGVSDWAWKSWMPSAAWIPGSHYWSRISTAWSGGRDPLGRPYSVPQAAASSIGIKLQPHDVGMGYYYRSQDLGFTRRRLQGEARNLRRDLDRGLITQAQYDREIRRVVQKMERLEQRARRLQGRD